MKLLIEKDKAISLLQTRIKELDAFDYNPGAWKSKTKTDVDAIFGNSEKNIEIIYLTLDSPYDAIKKQTQYEGKVNAKALLTGYIQSINEHIDDKKLPTMAPKASSQSELIDMQERLALEILTRKAAEFKSGTLSTDNGVLKNTIAGLQTEIKNLKGSMWQLEGLNIGKLLKVFGSLKFKDQFIVITSLIGIATAGFYIGLFFAHNKWL